MVHCVCSYTEITVWWQKYFQSPPSLMTFMLCKGYVLLELCITVHPKLLVTVYHAIRHKLLKAEKMCHGSWSTVGQSHTQYLGQCVLCPLTPKYHYAEVCGEDFHWDSKCTSAIMLNSVQQAICDANIRQTQLAYLFHRRTRASYVYNVCLAWYNVVLTHGSTQAWNSSA